MAANLNDKRVAILATDGVEQEELTDPRKALQEAGAEVHVIAPKAGEIRAWNHKEWGDNLPVDKTVDEVQASDYDALVLPGGVMNPDQLRQNEQAVLFTRAFADANKPIAAICHAPWLLINADIVRGRRLTSYPSLQQDLENAGAKWVDEEVVVDGGLVTSRRPADIPAFNKKTIETIAAA